ncbi:MAG: ATP-binding protein [Calditerrivibrio sp.]|nr:ATP-binding protein [Calditerrivibrio sp.]
MKKLPIGIQTFTDIRSDNYVYVDKTPLAYDLINNYRYVFLSRPRRFGKSLFLDTLRNIFEGNKELFINLYIYDKWDWGKKYPVIHIAIKGELTTTDLLREELLANLRNNQRMLGIVCETQHNITICFEELIMLTYEKFKQKVVILVDEYDKPILDNINNPSLAVEMRNILRGFYSVIKNSDRYIRFAFLTGVSKFTKTSIFSDLNMLTDISLDGRYGNICGYTQKDLEESFSEYLVDADLEKIKEWYNGYNFLADNLYNPFDILQFFASGGVFDNYWFETGTPSFLIKLLEQNRYFLPNLSNIKIDKKILNSFDIERLDFEVILFQSGYLTIDKMEITPLDTIEYTLKIPNKEVRQSLNDYILDKLFYSKNLINQKVDLFKTLLNNDLNGFKAHLSSVFSSIGYNNYINNYLSNYEGFYASIVYVYLQSLGFEIIGEDVTNVGRIDLTLKMPNVIYIIEFKVDTKDALTQLKEKRYYEKYLNLNKPIYLVGIEFDSKIKNIARLEWEEIKGNL